MVNRFNVKVTVVKKASTKDLWGSNTPATSKMEDVCPRFKVGQEFDVGEDGNMPEGFCPWAWNDVYGAYTHLCFGGDFPWVKESGTQLACCTDGFRPVFFKLERIEPER